MPASGPSAELKTLRKYVAELEKRFIAPYLTGPTLAPPSREEALQAAAYVVLAHGALENFLEGLALWVLDRVITNWTYKKRATRCTAAMLFYQKAPEADWSVHSSNFDTVRLALDEANTRQSKVIRDNNGVALHHVRELFYPLGIDVPTDPVLVASLDVLVSMRHYWAHQFRHGARVVKSAQDAKTAVGDCLTYAEKLAKEVKQAKP